MLYCFQNILALSGHPFRRDKMNHTFRRYAEYFPEKISVRHKRTERTEKKNFHLHEQVEIVFAISDNLKVQFEDRIVPLPKHTLLLLDSMKLHYIFSEEGSGICDRYVLYFSSSYISWLSTPEVNLMECFLLHRDETCVLLTVPDNQLEGVLHLLHQMESTASLLEKEPVKYGTDLHLKLLLGQFLLITNQLYYNQHSVPRAPLYREHAALVSEISEYIRKNYAEDLNGPQLARQFSISRTTLYHIFDEVFGMTINDYITEFRITKAKDLLINSSYSVELISDMTGYSTISSFSRLFKSRTGISPLQYRKNHSLSSA